MAACSSDQNNDDNDDNDDIDGGERARVLWDRAHLIKTMMTMMKMMVESGLGRGAQWVRIEKIGLLESAFSQLLSRPPTIKYRVDLIVSRRPILICRFFQF